MAQWNANGLHQHIDEVNLFLRHSYIDVLLISETHCAGRTYRSLPHYNEVCDTVYPLNYRKSPGPDLVTPKMLKELPKKGLLTLLYIFNGILLTHHWPAALKTTEIVLLLKPGKDPKMPESYRPISLLPTISKVLERLLANRITTDVTYTQRVPDHQFGFRHKHSTIQQVHRLCHTPSIHHLKQNNTAPAPSSTSAKFLISCSMMISYTKLSTHYHSTITL